MFRMRSNTVKLDACSTTSACQKMSENYRHSTASFDAQTIKTRSLFVVLSFRLIVRVRLPVSLSVVSLSRQGFCSDGRRAVGLSHKPAALDSCHQLKPVGPHPGAHILLGTARPKALGTRQPAYCHQLKWCSTCA